MSTHTLQTLRQMICEALCMCVIATIFSSYSTGQKKFKVPNGRCGGGAVAVRYLYARGTLEVRLKYARGTPEVRSRCGRGTLEVRSRYA